MTRRLAIASVLLAAAILLLVEVPLGLVYTDRARSRLLNSVERDARVLAALIEQELITEDLPSVSDIADRYAERTSGRVVVTDLDGIAVVDTASASAASDDFSDRPEVVAALEGSQDSGIAESDALNDEFGYVAVPIFSGGEVVGAMRVSEPTTEMRQRIRTIWITLGVLALSVLSAAFVGGWAIARSAARPIAALERVATRLAGGDLSVRSEADRGPPELRRLTRTFNDMAARLQLLVGSQQKFVADASHQLRTPLTALQLRIESIEDRLRTDTDIELEPTALRTVERDLDAVRAELERMTGLVDQLLALARAEGAMQVRTIDVACVARETVERWRSVAEAHSVTVGYRGPDSVAVHEATGAIEQILDNLIDNAIGASAPAGVIDVDVVPDEQGMVAVSVRDHGRGLPPEQLARAADRFWRAPDAPPGGSGLGLSIVSELASLSGGELVLSAPERGMGLLATVTLPAADDAG